MRVPEIFLFLWRTLNSDIVTQSNALSNQLSTHDTSIKSLLNNRGCVKSVQRIVENDVRFTETGSHIIQIQPINLSKSILLVRNCTFQSIPYATNQTDNGLFIISTLQASSIKLTSNGTNEYSYIDTKIYEAQVVEFY